MFNQPCKIFFNKYLKFLIVIFLFLSLYACGIYRKTDARTIPTDGLEKARKNIEEGRGISLKNLTGNKNTTYEFATANPLWRATLSTLDFLPILNVDYSGGVLVSDWYSDQLNSNTFIKITINFLSNEIRSDSLKIIIHEKKCLNSSPNSCTITLLKPNNIEDELRRAIISKATILDKDKKLTK